MSFESPTPQETLTRKLLTPEQVRLVDLATEGAVKAIQFDLDVESDRLKYSAWCSALATAGLALVLSNADKLLPTSPAPAVRTLSSVLVIAIPLIASAALGAWVNWQTNKESERKRQEMTLILKQRLLVLGDSDTKAEGRELLRQLVQKKFLEHEDQEFLTKIARETSRQIGGDKLLLWQQSLLVVGYAAALTCLLVKLSAG